jgi:hypothetical protein
LADIAPDPGAFPLGLASIVPRIGRKPHNFERKAAQPARNLAGICAQSGAIQPREKTCFTQFLP